MKEYCNCFLDERFKDNNRHFLSAITGTEEKVYIKLSGATDSRPLTH